MNNPHSESKYEFQCNSEQLAASAFTLGWYSKNKAKCKYFLWLHTVSIFGNPLCLNLNVLEFALIVSIRLILIMVMDILGLIPYKY